MIFRYEKNVVIVREDNRFFLDYLIDVTDVLSLEEMLSLEDEEVIKTTIVVEFIPRQIKGMFYSPYPAEYNLLEVHSELNRNVNKKILEYFNSDIVYESIIREITND